MPRGQKFKTSSTEAIIPTQQIPVSMRELLEIQSSVGAYQYPACPNRSANACKYSPAGRIPCGPINPRI